MRIVGASTTSAPTSSSARTSSPACSRARVTTMRRPRKGGTGRAGTGCGGECDMRGCNLSGTKTIIKQCSAPCARRWRGSPCGEPRRASGSPPSAPLSGSAWPAGSRPCSDPYPALVRLRRATEDRWGAVAAARVGTERFPDNADAWMLLGEAYQMVFRQKDALHAYEQALALEERPDAAVAAGDLYRRAGLLQEAAARFARAYAAGGGAEALWLNAQALFQAGEERAADEALHLWATQVPGGMERLSEARAELRGGKREDGGKREN